jgi:hypothetical protein
MRLLPWFQGAVGAQGGSLRAALLAARGTAQDVARGVRTSANNQRSECDSLAMQAALADDPAPRTIASELFEAGVFLLIPRGATVAA